MERLTENKIVLVTRQTRLEELILRFNTQAQASFYVEHLGADFSDYQEEHQVYRKAINEAQASLARLGRVQVVDRSHLPNFIFGPDDIVVVVGQDGLVANTLKYLPAQPLIAVNPDPLRWDGILLPFQLRDLKPVVRDVFQQRRQVKEISLAQVCLLDGQILLAVNDLFIGQRTHVSARYTVNYGATLERQSSSGIIVSTGLGSTGWLKSVVTGAIAISSRLNYPISAEKRDPRFAWNSDYLVFSVREPFPSRNSGAQIIYGRIDSENPFSVRSEMPENGVIFSDGIESDYLEFNSGMEARIEIAGQRGRLVV